MVALKKVNLQVEDKEYLCIVGPSGCGKTTLIKCIAGIIEPDEGEIYVDDRIINGLPIEDREVGYVFQEIALFPHMTVYDNVSYGPFVKGRKIIEAKDLIKEILNMMGLQDRAKEYPNALSGGARQKTAVARALISGSKLLLLDEPLGSLDAKVRLVLRYELRRLVKDLGLTAIHVTHDQEEAMSIADRMVVMRAGEIVEVGTPLELYMHPKKLFTAYFVGEANLFVGEIVKRNNYVKVNIDGMTLYSSHKVDFEDKEAVAVIRPEFIVVRRGKFSKGLWTGVIERKTFLGSVVRFEVRTNNNKMVAIKRPVSEASKFNVGDAVGMVLPPKALLLYPYPEEGLEKAISLE
ncbi:MAG: ABC transporter ATP-binding protein [Candidatus Bathyarchaeia archaeon]